MTFVPRPARPRLLSESDQCAYCRRPRYDRCDNCGRPVCRVHYVGLTDLCRACEAWGS